MMKKQNVETLQRAQGWWNCVADDMAYPFGAGTVKWRKGAPLPKSNRTRPAALRRTVQHPLRVSI